MLKASPPRLGMNEGCLLTPPLLNIVLEVVDSATRQKKEVKNIKTGKKKGKLSFTDKSVYIQKS